MDKRNIQKLLDLHDTFLNASLQYDRMNKASLEKDPVQFTISDRGRFERTWLAFLYVLTRSWQSEKMKDVRQFVLQVNLTTSIEELIEQGKRDGSIKKLKNIRHYMFHRDQKSYWDTGRLSVTNLEYNVKLHREFGKILIKTIRELEKDSPNNTK